MASDRRAFQRRPSNEFVRIGTVPDGTPLADAELDVRCFVPPAVAETADAAALLSWLQTRSPANVRGCHSFWLRRHGGADGCWNPNGGGGGTSGSDSDCGRAVSEDAAHLDLAQLVADGGELPDVQTLDIIGMKHPGGRSSCDSGSGF